MVWFRPAPSHYPSQYWQILMSPYCTIMCWVTVIISMRIPASPTHLWGETTGDRWFTQNSVMWSFCVCFVFSLNNLLDKQSSCPWWKTLRRQCHFTVLTTCHFLNVVRPHCVHSAKYFRNVHCLAVQVTLAIMNFNFTIQRWELIHNHFV